MGDIKPFYLGYEVPEIRGFIKKQLNRNICKKPLGLSQHWKRNGFKLGNNYIVIPHRPLLAKKKKLS